MIMKKLFCLLLINLFLVACGNTSSNNTLKPAAVQPPSTVNQVQKASLQSTIVRMKTAMGDIDIKLYDEQAPHTVANFLRYVASGAYDGSFVHRSVPGFIIQGGGYICNSTVCGQAIPVDSPVINEFSPNRSNLRGTIAMAKMAGDPNSATSEWFINLADNSANLDNQNGGFTVFGEVIGDSMFVVDAISGLQVGNASGAFSALPLISMPPDGSVKQSNLAMVQSVRILQESPLAVKLEGVPSSPQPAGAQVTFKATASGGTGNYEYQYWLSGDGLTWMPATDYSDLSSVFVDTNDVVPATYYIGVTIKRPDNILPNGQFESYAILPYTIQ